MSGLTINQMRIAIGKAYPGKGWIKKVLAMTDEQVIAVFNRLREQGKIKI